MRRLATLALFVPAVALAGPKGKPMNPTAGNVSGPVAHGVGACGAKVLPLAVDNQWTYENVASPLPPDDKVKRISPEPAKKIVITVKSIDAKKGADTVVTLEEKITIDRTKDPKKPLVEEHTLTTTITCTDKKFDISPDSFFFAGEPGGYYNLKVEAPERLKGTSWQLTKGGIGDAEWREDLAMKWSRVPTQGVDVKLGSGKLELERRYTPQQPENVVTKLGSYPKSEKLGLITTGRVTLDGAPADAKPMELPAGWVTTMWLAENVGVVQSLNAFAHEYQLVDAKLK